MSRSRETSASSSWRESSANTMESDSFFMGSELFGIIESRDSVSIYVGGRIGRIKAKCFR